jgi:hypothetical protein
MRPEVTARIDAAFEELYDALDGLHHALVNPDYRDEDWPQLIASYTDDAHLELHRLIALFQLSPTPGSDLQVSVKGERLQPD